MAASIIKTLEREEIARVREGKKLPDFAPGDTLRVNVKIAEGDRERIQAFEGLCIARSGEGVNENFTVRKLSFGEGVERVFPVHSPVLDSIEVRRKGKVRRAKLYYLRGRTGKRARIAEKTGVSREEGSDEAES
jgi:large subunit ribosomal protein L19